MSRNITFCYADYLKYIRFIENKSGAWRGLLTKYGLIYGTMLFCGPVYNSMMRPKYWVHYLNGHDVMLMYREKLLNL